MLLLAADTTTRNGSVALADGEEVVAELSLSPQEGHSSSLLPAIELVLRSASRTARDVEAWAVAVGPGAFTGLRVGISTIQGLALASGRPCVGVSALQAWAFGVAASAPAIVTLLDALRGDYYGQLFDADAAPRSAPRVVGPEDLPALAPARSAWVGDAVASARPAIEASCPGALFPRRRALLAAEVAALARREVAAGRAQAPEALRPLYLRPVALREPRRG
jgi:tRNA threonylcarbamoyladenosine biosynthesis protein TsaB